MSDNFSSYVPDVVFEKIPIRNLVSNQNYQRSLSESQILKAAEEFDLYQINPVKVSRRDGVNYVFDGQHTIEIVALVSQSRDTPVWCMIYNDLVYEHEAQVFAEQQKHSRPLCPFDIFVAQLESKSEKHLLIKSIVESYGLELTSNCRSYGSICAISSLEKIYDKYGFSVLDRTLRLCVGTWEGEQHSLSANMLCAVARLIAAFGESLSDEGFKERLGQYTAKVISRTAKERRPGSLGYAETLLMFYNKKCKYRLSMKKLYSGCAFDFAEADDEQAEQDESDDTE